jgi:glycosyl-4,4'-diaponeurosporenoate acyltransferase
MLLPLTPGWAALVGGLMWGVLSLATGYVAHRLPVRRFEHDNRVTRLRGVERDGRIYERWFRIRTWKRWLPEGGDIFEGGFNKKHLRSRDPAFLARFVAETRRAELTHWVAMAWGPLFYLWSPLGIGTVMVAFGVGFNTPCILAQRYNRARFLRLMARRNRHRAATLPPGPPGPPSQHP